METRGSRHALSPYHLLLQFLQHNRRAQVRTASLVQFGSISLDPPIHRCMIYCESPLQHHFFQIAVTERIAKIPPHTQQDNVRLEVTGGGASPAPRHLKGCLGFMDEVGWANDSKYKYYLYQTTTSFCNTTSN